MAGEQAIFFGQSIEERPAREGLQASSVHEAGTKMRVSQGQPRVGAYERPELDAQPHKEVLDKSASPSTEPSLAPARPLEQSRAGERSGPATRGQEPSETGTTETDWAKPGKSGFSRGGDGSISWAGTQGDDDVQISADADGQVSVNAMGGGFWKLDARDVKSASSISFDMGAGNDKVEVFSHRSAPPLTVSGGAGNDTIEATGGGVITAHGQEGDDKIRIQATGPGSRAFGGAGNDGLSASESTAGVLFDGGDGDDSLRGGAEDDVLLGGRGMDNLLGKEGRDVIRGGAQNDSIHGMEGDDQLFGDEGNDFLDGGSGHDLVDAGAGKDIAFGGKGNDRIVGGDGDDHLAGGSGNDRFDGGAGLDNFAVDPGEPTAGRGSKEKVDVVDTTKPVGTSVKMDGGELVDNELEDLRSIPEGRALLAALDAASARTGKTVSAQDALLFGYSALRTDEKDGGPPTDMIVEGGIGGGRGPDESVTPGFVSMAHELVHALHGIEGSMTPSTDKVPYANGTLKASREELLTTGVPYDHDNNPKTPDALPKTSRFSDNNFRRILGIYIRPDYPEE